MKTINKGQNMLQTLQSSAEWLWEQSAKAAQEWHAIQCRNLYAAVYLYYRRGELRAAEDKPAGFELADGRRLGPSGTTQELTARIHERARSLPCLPEESGVQS